MREMVKKFIFTKKGLSAVITSLMLILLALVLVGMLWAIIGGLTEDKLDDAESCFDIFGKIEINEEYTCYDSSTKELQFSINRGDIEIDKLLIAISGDGKKQSIEIPKEDTSLTYLKYYQGTYNEVLKIPDKNQGRTYVYNITDGGFTSAPDGIEIVPVIGGSQCGVSSSLEEIVSCS